MYDHLTDRDLEAEIAHARNRRDAFAAGREPSEVLAELRRLLTEQSRRRALPRVLTPASEVEWCDDACCPRDECVACQREGAHA